MKEILNKYKIYYLFFLLFAMYSCSNEITETEQMKESLTIEKAKEWFDLNIQTIRNSDLFKVKSYDSTYMNLKPLFNWDLAEIDNDALWSVVELPWEFEDGQIRIANADVKYYIESSQISTQQILRLVILKNRKTDEIYGFKMAVVPDLDYMLNKGSEINANHYLNRDPDLSGTIMFYSLTDEFINGWKYQNGKIIAKLISSECVKDKNQIGLMKVAAAWDYYTIETCWYQYTISGGIRSATQLLGCTTETYVELAELDSKLDSGGGGLDVSGGGSVINTATENVIKYFKATLKKTMEKQLSNTCVTSIMEYINHELCGGTINQGVYDLDYLKNFKENIYKNGVSLTNLNSFVSNHFTLSNGSNWKDVIDKGGVVMTTVTSSITNSTHNVLIVGYGSDGTIYYMDPETGVLESGTYNSFSWSYNIGISGCK